MKTNSQGARFYYYLYEEDIASLQEKHSEKLSALWSHLFGDDDLETHFARLDSFATKTHNASIEQFFRDLRTLYFFYLFEQASFTIADLSKLSKLSISKVAFEIRSIFKKRYEYTTETEMIFNVMGLQCTGAHTRFNAVTATARPQLAKLTQGLIFHELTMYPTWQKFLGNFGVEKNISRSLDKVSGPKSFIKELAVMFFLGGVLIFSIKHGNKFYEDYLIKQVSLNEINLNWLKKDEVYLQRQSPKNEIELSHSEIEKIEESEWSEPELLSSEPERYEDESDVIVASFKNLPQDFDRAGMEKSAYEERQKGGYRDFRWGSKRAYRVMLTSINPQELKNRLASIIGNYRFRKADSVDPGTRIPGGFYFNLYIDRDDIQNFLSQMDSIAGVTILESKTIHAAPDNMSKVFIWIKEV